MSEAAAGVSSAANSDNFRAVYTPSPGTRLTSAFVSASRNGGAISAAELNGRAQAVVYVRQGEDDAPSVITSATITGQFPSNLRVIGAAFCGDARNGFNPASIPLDYVVQEGEQIVVEVSAWVDGAGVVVASQSLANLHGRSPERRERLR